MHRAPVCYGVRPAAARRGITLTEVLIAIMILGIGLVSLAALFPIGLARLRDASRYSRSAYLLQSAAADLAARGLLNKQAFGAADRMNFNFLNNQPFYPFWYVTPNGTQAGLTPPHFDPFTQDTQFYGGNAQPDFTNNPPTYFGAGGVFYDPNTGSILFDRGTGLPIAYDPLWRYQTVNPGNPYSNYLGNPQNANNQPNPQGGYYLFDNGALEARFGSGIGFLRNDPSDAGLPSAHGLQRLTNFNRPAIMPAALGLPNIFVSPEDIVLQDPAGTAYTIDGVPAALGGLPVTRPSPVIPDLNTSLGSTINDWRYSWMFTGLQTNVPPSGVNTSNGATFEGNIVIFENRRFGINQVQGPFAAQAGQVDGEIVVEAVFGYSTAVVPQGAAVGYGSGADRIVLLRWPTSIPDPVVKVGSWLADVTYERDQNAVFSRFVGVANPINNGEFDNLPAQRCFWYQVQRVVPPANVIPKSPLDFDNGANGPYRYMFVYVNTPLAAKTLLNATGQQAPVGSPVVLNAALIAPDVVNVIPQTILVR